MNWLKRIFGSRREDARLERLVRRLISPDEATFLDALREATALAPKGDDLGVRALSEVIRRKSGRRDATFYAPAFGELTVLGYSEIVEAEGKLIQLAESQALLSDPAKSQNLIFTAMADLGGDLRQPLMVTSDGQNLISAAMTVLKQKGLAQLAQKILAVGGVEQFFSFQLLFNHVQSFITLGHARGERSWEEKMMKEVLERFEK